jgi:HAD superfamily hydrolase (TIGR01509 family)
MTRRYRGVLLDVDGTLLDSVEAHALAWRDAFHAHDHEVGVLQIKQLIGMGGDHLVSQLTGVEAGTREFEAMSKHHGELFREQYLPRLGPVPGARALVLRLRSAGYHVAVASSAKGDDLERLLARADVEDLIEQRATASDVEHSKPDPDIVEAAIAKLPFLYAYETVMIGDTPYDIEAARRAGVDTIGVASGGFAATALSGAVAVYGSVGDLLARWDDSPLAP